MNKRIGWIDYAKTICIFLVVLGHSQIPLATKSIFYVFHIPLFFFISGILFSFEKYTNYGPFLKKRLFQLVIPYFFFNATTYLFWLLIGRKVGNDVSLGLHPMKQFFGIFWGNDANHYLEHCAPLWFLSCLFVVENLYYLIFKNLSQHSRIIAIILFAIIGYLDYRINPIRFPWGINVALTTIVFYGLGVLTNKKIINLKKYSISTYFIITTLSLTGVILTAILNGKIEVSIGYYGNYGLFLIGALSGICLVICLSKIIEFITEEKTAIQYIGKNTLIILGFHILSGSAIKATTYYIFHLPISIYETPHIAFLYSIFSILILLPVMFFMNKYLPFFIGKTKL